MKLTFIGTGAGEGYPGLWCECPHCTYARKTGGKNLRVNSCAVIDEKLMLDIGPACFDNAARFGVNLTHAEALLITHPHSDHFYPQHLEWRITKEENISLFYRDKMFKFGPRFTDIPHLSVFGNARTKEAISPLKDKFEAMKLSFSEIHEGEPFEICGYRVTPVRGNHGEPGLAHSYIIQNGLKTLLYALDSGSFDDEMKELLKKFEYDAIVMEGTSGLNEHYGGHMCLANNLKWKDFFKENNCMKDGCRFILTHMSPHWCPPHDWYESIVESEGVILAYDGYEIEI